MDTILTTPQMVVEDRGRHLFRVARRAFTDEAVLEAERQAIFDRCWLYLGHSSEIAGNCDFITRAVGGRELIFNRDRGGAVHAFLNTCPHRGAMVVREKKGNALSFRCFYHGWSFNVNGRFASRFDEGNYGKEHYGGGCADLAQVPRLESYRDFLFVAFSDSAGSLVDYLAGAKDYIDLVVDQGLERGIEVVPGTQHYGLRANWKLLAENSIDTYHVMALHRRYVEYVVQQGQVPTRPVGRARDLGNGHAVSETAPPLSCKPVAHWGPPMPESKRAGMTALYARLVSAYGTDRARMIGQTYRQLLIFPNLMLIDTCATTIRTWSPRDHQSMDVTAWALAPRDQPPDERALTLQSFNLFFGPGGFATPDDIEMLEQCQNGFVNEEVRYIDCSRGMNRAEPAYDDDLPLRAFWRRWQQLMSEPC
jgi:p-cumate 2,3-dioxygenase alpha subunit